MICGQNLSMKGIMDQVSKMKSDLLSTMDLDAGGLKSQLSGEIVSLVGDIRGMTPKMPSTANVNLQTELSSLMSLSPSSSAYTAKHAKLLGQFGSALTGKGINFDSIISGLSAGSLDVCGGVPNFELPTGTAVAIEKAAGSLKPQVEAVKEELSTIVRNPGMVSAKTANETLSAEWKNPDATESTVYEVSEKVTTLKNDSNLEIKMAVSTDMITEVSSSSVPVATVPSKKTPEGKIISPAKTKERSRANYNKYGNAARPRGKTQLFKSNFDRMELTNRKGKSINPILSIEKVRVWWKAENGRSMRKEVKNQTVVEFADMPAWGWTMSAYEPGNAIEIENISNIEQVSVRYKYPARSDPRWKKTALKQESV